MAAGDVTISVAQATAMLSALNAIVAQLVLINEQLAKTSTVDISGSIVSTKVVR